MRLTKRWCCSFSNGVLAFCRKLDSFLPEEPKAILLPRLCVHCVRVFAQREWFNEGTRSRSTSWCYWWYTHYQTRWLRPGRLLLSQTVTLKPSPPTRRPGRPRRTWPLAARCAWSHLQPRTERGRQSSPADDGDVLRTYRRVKCSPTRRQPINLHELVRIKLVWRSVFEMPAPCGSITTHHSGFGRGCWFYDRFIQCGGPELAFGYN